MALKIKKGDRVIVLTGRDKGKQGEVIRTIPSENRAVVRGINVAKRHQKQTAAQEGGIVSKELPIQVSNLALIDPKDGKPAGWNKPPGWMVIAAQLQGLDAFRLSHALLRALHEDFRTRELRGEGDAALAGRGFAQDSDAHRSSLSAPVRGPSLRRAQSIVRLSRSRSRVRPAKSATMASRDHWFSRWL